MRPPGPLFRRGQQRAIAGAIAFAILAFSLLVPRATAFAAPDAAPSPGPAASAPDAAAASPGAAPPGFRDGGAPPDPAAEAAPPPPVPPETQPAEVEPPVSAPVSRPPAPPPPPPPPPPADQPPLTPPGLTAVRIPHPPTLDGVVLGDEAWAGAPAASSFWQRMPDEGRPATEATEVRVAYTADTLYVGVVLYDLRPADIVVAGSRRDASLDNSDAFLVVFDTFLDRQNGFVFGTNPAGIELDGQLTNEGQGGGGGLGGSGAGFNVNWDGSWEVRTSVGKDGWSAEFAIPLRTLRYAGSGKQRWGVNFQRNIRRKNEVAYWAPLPRQFNLYRVSAAGTLEGLDLPAQRNLKLIPYVLREALRDHEAGAPWRWRSNGGVDLKYSVTPSLTFDGTIGTDFSQVEADEQQINLNRFNLFFPEKRPFFLENAGLFAVGDPGDVDVFFSRRIGIGPDGEVIPIVGGARLSGKVGPVRIGLLDMQAERVADVAPANNFAVGRVALELPNRSAVGAIVVNRQATGVGNGGDWNRAFAVDGRVGIGRYALVSAFAARTDTPADDERRPYAGQLSGRYDSANWFFEGGTTYVGPDFQPDVGFLRRENYTKLEGTVMYRHRPRDWLGFYELRPHAQAFTYVKPDGVEESRFVHLDNHWEWRNGYELHTGVNFTRETVLEAFEIYPAIDVPVGRYDHVEALLNAETNQAAPLAFGVTFTGGGFFGGKRLAVVPRLRLRAGDTFVSEVVYSHNEVDLPVGDFVTNLVRFRVSYAFTPRLFVQALLQYNDKDDLFATNLRFGWLQTANAGLYVVYNENSDPMSRWWERQTRNRSIVAKLTLQVDVL